jgi:DNA-binding MarR family transcriptional regulator
MSPISASDPSLLPDRLEPVRQIVIQLNDLGIELTRAIADAGLGDLSTNVAIAVLTKLSIDGPTRPRALLRSTRLSRGGLSNLFDRLEASNLITRTYGQIPGDRRGALVAVTDAGAAAAAEIADVVARSLDRQRPAIIELTDTLAEITPHGAPPNTSTAHHTDIERLELLSQMGAALDDALAGDDPTPGKTAIVLCSAAQPGHTRPKELIERTQLTSGGVTQLLDRLETSDLIHRATDQPPDRRAVIVELTPHGRRHLELVLGKLARRLDMIRSVVDNLDS